MRAAFWFSFGVIAYTYAGYPLLIWALSRIRPRPWRRAPIMPSVSIVMAVHNGEALLARKIEHLSGLDYPNIKEIIVVSDGSTDGTETLLSLPHGSRLQSIILREHSGKAVALNAGIAAASGEILLFVDIRPEIAEGSVAQLVSNFADPTVGCVAGELVLRQDGHDSTATAVSGLYWRYEQWIRNCEAAWDSPVGVYGGFYAIRRDVASAFPAGIILDDMFQPLAIVQKGYRAVLDQNAVVYDTWPKKSDDEFNRKVRTLAGNFQLFHIAPWVLTAKNRIVFQLISHKVMRLVVPFMLVLFMASSLVLAMHSATYSVFAALITAALVITIISARFPLPLVSRIAGPASALLMLNAAAVVGLYRFLFTKGPLWKIWGAPAGPKTTGLKRKAAEA